MALSNCDTGIGSVRTMIKRTSVAIGGGTHARPDVVLGQIKKRQTKGRPTPPEPISGLNTADTPFDRGHVFGLENGGPDLSENIVPRYR